jgi:D-glycero-alpha-D-manno-heptose 1-phosphate guanylyltransferase
MQAIVLCGGQGTRLRAICPDRPKALAPVSGRPFIEWQVDWLRRGGITAIHLATGHLGEQIAAWAAGQPDVTVSRETTPLGTAGALAAAAKPLAADSFWVLNGDTLLPGLDFQGLEKGAANSSKDWKLMVAVTHTEHTGRFGTVAFDAARRITGFLEKGAPGAGWINGGVYRVPRAALRSIGPARPCSLETAVFPALAAAGRLYAFPTAPPLLDMGTAEGLEAMERYLQTTRAPGGST